MKEFDALKRIMTERRSIRRFSKTRVGPEYIENMIEAARLAPSGSNRQPWRFILFSKSTSDRLQEKDIIKQKFVLDAPVKILCCVDKEVFAPNNQKKRLHELIKQGALDKGILKLYGNQESPSEEKNRMQSYLDLGIAGEHMVLAASSMGLGTCWIRLFDFQAMHNLLNLPLNYEVIALLVAGFPAEEPLARPRNELRDIYTVI